MYTGDKTGQSAILAHGIQEDGDEERSPPEELCELNVCCHHGGEGGVGEPHPAADLRKWQLVPLAHVRGMEEDRVTPTQQLAAPACSQREEGEGEPPKLQCAHHARERGREGATLTRQRTTPACS